MRVKKVRQRQYQATSCAAAQHIVLWFADAGLALYRRKERRSYMRGCLIEISSVLYPEIAYRWRWTSWRVAPSLFLIFLKPEQVRRVPTGTHTYIWPDLHTSGENRFRRGGTCCCATIRPCSWGCTASQPISMVRSESGRVMMLRRGRSRQAHRNADTLVVVPQVTAQRSAGGGII